MNSISLVGYAPTPKNHGLTARLIECYRDVFADEPWHEWLKCPTCGLYWGLKDQTLLASMRYKHCGVALVDFWARDQVLSDICEEIKNDTFSMLAVDGNNVVGFSWGYSIQPGLLEEKVGVKFCPELCRRFGPQSAVGYQDEIGVLGGYRGRKIAKKLNKYRVEALAADGAQVVVSRARRTPTPSVTFSWYTEKLGYLVLADYPPEDGRVILARRIEGLMGLL